MVGRELHIGCPAGEDHQGRRGGSAGSESSGGNGRSRSDASRSWNHRAMTTTMALNFLTDTHIHTDTPAMNCALPESTWPKDDDGDPDMRQERLRTHRARRTTREIRRGPRLPPCRSPCETRSINWFRLPWSGCVEQRRRASRTSSSLNRSWTPCCDNSSYSGRRPDQQGPPRKNADRVVTGNQTSEVLAPRLLPISPSRGP